MNRILQLLSILALAAGTGFHASAQEAAAPAPAQQAPDQISQLAEMVGLSEEQETEIRSIVDTMTPKIEKLQTEAQAAQAELAEMAGPDYDEAAIREKAGQLGELQGQMTAESILLQSKVDAVFTEEQRAQLEAMQRQQEQMRQQQMQRQIQQQMQQMQQPQPAPQE